MVESVGSGNVPYQALNNSPRGLSVQDRMVNICPHVCGLVIFSGILALSGFLTYASYFSPNRKWIFPVTLGVDGIFLAAVLYNVHGLVTACRRRT